MTKPVVSVGIEIDDDMPFTRRSVASWAIIASASYGGNRAELALPDPPSPGHRCVRLPLLPRSRRPARLSQRADHRGPGTPANDPRAPPPASPERPAPRDPGQVPLTVAVIKRLLSAATAHVRSIWHAAGWSRWQRRHQAHARWYQRTCQTRPETPIRPGQAMKCGCRNRLSVVE